MKYIALIFSVVSFFLTSQIFADCSENEIAKIRDNFQREFNNKNYEKAHEILEPVLQCEINPQKMLWIMNDLMLTEVKQGDYWSACRTSLPHIEETMKKVKTSEQFMKAFKNVSANCDGDYFGVMKKILAIPEGAKGIYACDNKEQEKIFELIKKTNTEKDVVKELEMSSVTIYKGDFSNQGRIDYVVVSEAGSGHYDTLHVYHIENDKLISVMSDYNKFDEMRDEINIADPFAFVKDNKVYIRIMHYPKADHFDYDSSQLYICTYLLEKNKLTLAGPNYRGTWPEYKVVPFNGCYQPK